MHSRRQIISSTLLISGGMAIASVVGCATKTTNSQLVMDVNLLDTGLSGLVAALAALPNGQAPSAQVMAQLNTEIGIIHSQAQNIANAATEANTVNAIQTAVSTIASLTTPFFPESGIIASVVNAAVAVAANLVTMLTPPAPAPAGIGGAPHMNLDTARSTLRGAPLELRAAAMSK